VAYSVTLSDFLTGALILNVSLMAEYSLLNYCSTVYNKYRIKINDTIDSLKKKMAKKNLKKKDVLKVVQQSSPR